MIKIKITKAPNEIYLGEREFFFDKITIGKDAKVPIKTLDLSLPLLTLEIESNFLLVRSEIEFHLNHNDTEKPLPFKINLGDRINYKSLEIQILDFKAEPAKSSMKDTIESEIKKHKDDKQFLKFIKKLSS